jgi:hypothetical protein
VTTDDFAILIGISSYPELGAGGKSADLKGPGNDVDAIKAWLLDPKGGGFTDASKIQVIKSQHATSAANAHPTADELELALSGLDTIAQANRQAGRGMRVGRRLYIFMSGHGFSPGRHRGCLYTANAMERVTFNVHATGWLNWLQDAGYFREFVLWMDCCMNRMSFLQPRDPPLPLVNSPEPPRASFVAFAAQRPLKAVEAPIPEDGGMVHGVFTWTLLEGLRGAAADSNGRVTGHSLADWVRNALAARLAPRDLEDADVAKEPEVIQEDPRLIFARGVSKPLYRVTVSFPPSANGQTARLWGESPPSIAQSFSVSGAPEELSLRPGLFLIDVPGARLRQGFEVVKPMEVLIKDQGDPVTPAVPGTVFQLEIDPSDVSAELFVTDWEFSLADSSPARLSTPLPFGLFKIKTRIGRVTTQHVILLDRDRPPMLHTAILQPTAIVPIFGTAASHEYHTGSQRAAIDAANALDTAADQAVIMVMARAFSGKDAPVPGTKPWAGVSIVDVQGKAVIDLDSEGQRDTNRDPSAFCVKAVAPGSYFLRQRLEDGGIIEQSLIVCKSWRHEVYVLRRVLPGQTAFASRPRVSIMMHGLGEGPGDDEEARLIETARVALADERRILNPDLENMLLQKSRNPMAGIIGGHLLLVERERDPGRDLSVLDTVVRNLQSLVGKAHPDVAALALQCGDARLKRFGSLVAPPMLHNSWKLLADAARKRPELIPAAMFERVQAQTVLPLYLIWAIDESTKQDAQRDLASAIFRPPATRARRPRQVAPPAAMGDVIAVPPTVQRAVTKASSERLVRQRMAEMSLPPSALEVLKTKAP